MDGMFSLFKRITAGVLALGIALWAPGVPLALAQVDAGTLADSREILAADPTLDPATRELCLELTDRALEAVQRPDAAPPEAVAELEAVETTAVAIREATQTTLKAVENPDAVAKSTVEALTKSGVPSEVAAKTADQMKDALAKAKEAIQQGGTVEDAAKYLETCKSAMAGCKTYLGEKNIREIFATSGGAAGVERGEARNSMDFLGRVIDPATQGKSDLAGECLKAHFETSMKEAFLSGSTGGPEGRVGPSAEVMKGMMEQMMACNINPREVFAGTMAEFHGGPMGGPGEFHGPGPTGEYAGPAGPIEGLPPEVAGLSPEAQEQFRTAMEGAYRTGDWESLEATREQLGLPRGEWAMGQHHDYAGNVVTPEKMFQEMEQMRQMETQYREIYSPEQMVQETVIHDTTYVDVEPKVVENQNYNNTQENIGKYADGHTECPVGKTHVTGVPDGPGHCA